VGESCAGVRAATITDRTRTHASTRLMVPV
jgi:hypothetical protein